MENRLSRALQGCQEALEAYWELWDQTRVEIYLVRRGESVTEYSALVTLDGETVETVTVSVLHVEGWEDTALLLPGGPDPATGLGTSSVRRGMFGLAGIHSQALMDRLQKAFRDQGIALAGMQCGRRPGEP